MTGPPLRLHPAAQGDVGGRPYRARRRRPRACASRRSSALTAAAFGQRRKMLRQSLKGVPGALEALEAARDRSDAARRDAVSVDEFVALARDCSTLTFCFCAERRRAAAVALARRRGRAAGPWRSRRQASRRVGAALVAAERLDLGEIFASRVRPRPWRPSPRPARAARRRRWVRAAAPRGRGGSPCPAGRAPRATSASATNAARLRGSTASALSSSVGGARRDCRRPAPRCPAASSAIDRGSIWSSGRWPCSDGRNRQQRQARRRRRRAVKRMSVSRTWTRRTS